MTFKTKSRVLDASTEAELVDLVDAALRNRERFSVEKAPAHNLSVVAYDDGRLFFELHRGKKSDGWLSGPMAVEAGRAILIAYFREPLDTLGGIEKEGQWHEAGVFPPAVILAVAVVLLAVIIWSVYF